MININTAKSPWALLYFSALSFFSLLQGREVPLHGEWNLHKSRVRYAIRTWNNIGYAKKIKRRKTIMQPSFINLLFLSKNVV